MPSDSKRTGVVIMSYGSAGTAEHVGEYLGRIYGEKVSKTLIEDFENRYRLVGHSPLVEITDNQALLLQKKLGASYVVKAGMRHSEPFIEDAALECRRGGAAALMGIILSPQFSSFIMSGYTEALRRAGRKAGFNDKEVVVADSWPTEEHFIELLGMRVKEALKKLRARYGSEVPVIFTTHSLPQRVVAKDPHYLEELQATINGILAHLRKENPEWYAAYQSAGHTPEEWLKPDLVDVLSTLSTKKVSAVLIVPIQFLADHLEILYDLDIAARKQCEEFTIAYHRTELPNIDPLFIDALAAIVHATEKK